MKLASITRALDKLGRVVIPKEFREKMQLKTGDEFEVLLTQENLIVLRRPGCMFCGSNGAYYYYKKNKICKVCIEVIKGLK